MVMSISGGAVITGIPSIILRRYLISGAGAHLPRRTKPCPESQGVSARGRAEACSSRPEPRTGWLGNRDRNTTVGNGNVPPRAIRSSRTFDGEPSPPG